MNSDYERAVVLVATSRKAGAAFLRQKLLLSESKVNRLLTQMQKAGVVSPPMAGGARQVLIPEPPKVDQEDTGEQA